MVGDTLVEEVDAGEASAAGQAGERGLIHVRDGIRTPTVLPSIMLDYAGPDMPQVR
jgi:hypothetical protein